MTVYIIQTMELFISSDVIFLKHQHPYVIFLLSNDQLLLNAQSLKSMLLDRLPRLSTVWSGSSLMFLLPILKYSTQLD